MALRGGCSAEMGAGCSHGNAENACQRSKQSRSRSGDLPTVAVNACHKQQVRCFPRAESTRQALTLEYPSICDAPLRFDVRFTCDDRLIFVGCLLRFLRSVQSDRARRCNRHQQLPELAEIDDEWLCRGDLIVQCAGAIADQPSAGVIPVR
jgi:hypothetical protein